MDYLVESTVNQVDEPLISTEPKRLTWGLCIATYNRASELELMVEYAVRQIRPPVEVVICDSSPNWQLTASRVKQVVEAIAPTTRLCYLGSPKAQQTIQRNIAVRHSLADILFMIDDDAYLSPDASRRILDVYEADHDGEIAAVGIGAMKSWNGFNSSDVGSLDLGGDRARNLLGK
jgi:glycosyltransferase involved in cell wall biosynthesis